MTEQELANTLARTAFCPDCHRLMEVTSTMEVKGEGNVPVDWKCHYCEGQFTSDAEKAENKIEDTL